MLKSIRFVLSSEATHCLIHLSVFYSLSPLFRPVLHKSEPLLLRVPMGLISWFYLAIFLCMYTHPFCFMLYCFRYFYFYFFFIYGRPHAFVISLSVYYDFNVIIILCFWLTGYLSYLSLVRVSTQVSTPHALVTRYHYGAFRSDFVYVYCFCCVTVLSLNRLMRLALW